MHFIFRNGSIHKLVSFITLEENYKKNNIYLYTLGEGVTGTFKEFPAWLGKNLSSFCEELSVRTILLAETVVALSFPFISSERTGKRAWNSKFIELTTLSRSLRWIASSWSYDHYVQVSQHRNNSMWFPLKDLENVD